LDVAATDFTVSRQPHDDDEVEQVSHFDFDRHSNTAEVSVQLSPISECFSAFCQNHDDRYQTNFHDLVQWLISEDSSASSMRFVSLLEIYVGFRCSRDGRSPLCCGHSVSPYHVITFAADFKYFKKIFRHVFESADVELVYRSIDLTSVKIVNPQVAIRLGWGHELETQVLSRLQQFIGQRPVSSAQALARPWQP